MTAYDSAVLVDSPLLYWKMDEASGNVIDSSGNGRDGTAAGAGRLYQQAGPGPGRPYGIDVPASPSPATFTAAATALLAPQSMSVEFWFYDMQAGTGRSIFDKAPNPYDWFVSKPAAASGSGYLMWRRYAPDTNAIDADTSYGPLYALNVWHHFLMTSTPTAQKIYIDGVLANSPSGSTGAIPTGVGQATATPVVVGNAQGRIAAVAIYGSALSAARALAHYNAMFFVQTHQMLIGG